MSYEYERGFVKVLVTDCTRFLDDNNPAIKRISNFGDDLAQVILSRSIPDKIKLMEEFMTVPAEDNKEKWLTWSVLISSAISFGYTLALMDNDLINLANSDNENKDTVK